MTNFQIHQQLETFRTNFPMTRVRVDDDGFMTYKVAPGTAERVVRSALELINFLQLDLTAKNSNKLRGDCVLIQPLK